MKDERFQTLLRALSIGDAFGAGVEFQDRDWIRQNVDFTRFVNARHKIEISDDRKALFVENYNLWDYTDDTEMTIGLIKALMENEPFTEDLLVRKWREEYEDGIRCKGYGRNGHGSMRWYYDGEKTIEEIRDFQRHRPNPGNAPAMRSVPLGLLPDHLIDEYAAINARATHPNEIAIISSQLVAHAANYLLVQEGSPTELIQYCCKRVSLNREYEIYLSGVEKLPVYNQLTEADFITLCGPQPIVPPYFLPGIKGVSSDSKFTTGCILYVLQQSTDAMDALQKSILLGGDVDSVASVTTGIVAGLHGLSSLPDFMLDMTEKINGLDELCQAFNNII
jgi:ADP-ribosylglycohydrolase